MQTRILVHSPLLEALGQVLQRPYGHSRTVLLEPVPRRRNEYSSAVCVAPQASCACPRGCPLADRKMVELSLAAASAKTWICEKNLAGNKVIRASDLALVEDEIQNDWLDLARAVKAGAAPQGQFQLYSAAFNGVRAPIADQFEVKGGWISHDDRREYVTPAKYDRDCQVFMFGFT